MGMEFHGNIARGFENDRDERARALGSEQASNIFEADTPRLGRSGFGRLAGIIFVGMARRNGIDQVMLLVISVIGLFFFRSSISSLKAV